MHSIIANEYMGEEELIVEVQKSAVPKWEKQRHKAAHVEIFKDAVC